MARQDELASRLVALKVTQAEHEGAAWTADESQALARLQHTNIVPIHSIHAAGPFRAVCMPYRGSTTLADVIRGLRGSKSLPASGRHIVSTVNNHRLSTVKPESVPGAATIPTRRSSGSTAETSAAAPSESCKSEPRGAAADGHPPQLPRTVLDRFERQTYVQSVLWIGAKLADGLAHAHDCGIVHRDLKPANVLMTDDGQPMLLDFNLADTTVLHGSEAARVGGTLPYMSPEQLAAFHDPKAAPVDGRTDIYSLGLVLFELLTGRPAYPVRTGPVHSVVAAMRGPRHAGSPSDPAQSGGDAGRRNHRSPMPGARPRQAVSLGPRSWRISTDTWPICRCGTRPSRRSANGWGSGGVGTRSWHPGPLRASSPRLAVIAAAGWLIVHGRELARLRALDKYSELQSAGNAQLMLLDAVVNSPEQPDAAKAVEIARCTGPGGLRRPGRPAVAIGAARDGPAGRRAGPVGKPGRRHAPRLGRS